MHLQHWFATAGLLTALPFATPAAATDPGYATHIEFRGAGVVRSNFVDCYYDYQIGDLVCLDPSHFNLSTPGTKVTVTASYTTMYEPMPITGDATVYFEGSFQFDATPSDGSSGFSFGGDPWGTMQLHNGRPTNINVGGIGGDDCGFSEYVGYFGSARAASGKFESGYCAYYESVFPFYGLAGDWHMTAYRLDDGPWTAVPEPASWAMLVAGFALVGGVVRRRRVRITA